MCDGRDDDFDSRCGIKNSVTIGTDRHRGAEERSRGHLSVTEFKVKKELEMLADIDDVKNEMLDELGDIEKKTEQAKKGADAAEARAAQIIPKVKKLDEIAREYAGDVEQKLPQPDILESARSYRDKKTKPAFRRFQKVYLALYDAYHDLKRICENLQKT